MLEIATERLVLRPLEIEGKVRTAKGVEEMNAALASVIAGMWLGVECGTLRAEFQLQPLASDISTYALPQILSQDLAGERHLLAPTPGMPPGSRSPAHRERVQNSTTHLGQCPAVAPRTPRSIIGTGDCYFARRAALLAIGHSRSDTLTGIMGAPLA